MEGKEEVIKRGDRRWWNEHEWRGVARGSWRERRKREVRGYERQIRVGVSMMHVVHPRSELCNLSVRTRRRRLTS
jgi:hypothetical protein